MSVVTTTSVLQKQQNKLPTSMRYERVRDILKNDPALKNRLGPETEAVDTRFGEKLYFSREVIDVTNALHAEGRDAHKVPQNEVLRLAIRVMRVLPANGEARAITQQPAPETTPAPAAPVAAPQPPPASDEKKKSKGKVSGTGKSEESKESAQAANPDTTGKAAKGKKSSPKSTPVTPTMKAAKSVKSEKSTKPESSESQDVVSQPEANSEETCIPESELPPEKQPLHLPPNFDPRKWPHYSVQSSIYSLLLSALNLSDHFEKIPGCEGRQQRLESLIKEYQDTCDAIRIGT